MLVRVYASQSVRVSEYSLVRVIRKNPGFRLKHTGVADGSDESDGTSYPLMENYMLPVAQAMGHIAYLLPLLCARNAVTDMHHQNDTYGTLFAAVAVMQLSFTQPLVMLMPFFGR
jgi:hypothetical protein